MLNHCFFTGTAVQILPLVVEASIAGMEAPTMEVLFGNQAKAVIDFEHCRRSHPRFQFDNFEIPKWLRGFQIVNFKGTDADPVVAKAVHKRYHMDFDNLQDRFTMSDIIAACETFAIVRPGVPPFAETSIVLVVAAITFAVIDDKVQVFFLSADDRYRKAGFGTQLLMLTGQCVKHRSGLLNRISMYLLANEENAEAWKFYDKRGFKVASQPASEIIQEFIDHPIFSSFVGNETGCLKLLCLHNFHSSFQFGFPSAAKTPPCFLLDPWRPMFTNKVDDPMVYAQFPGTMSLKELNHCGKDIVIFQQPGTLQVHDDGPVGVLKGLPKSQYIVSWASRTEIRTGCTMLNPVLSMFLAWLQRDREAPIWKDRVTIVPTCILIPLWNTHFLLQRYLNACAYDGDQDFDQIRSATFHPDFDNQRFMAHAKDLMAYIYANCEELFSKPYIVMFPEDLNMDWTCFVAVNAGTIARSVSRKDGEKVCGFFTYDPMAADDNFQNRGIKSEDPQLFFLTLARHIMQSGTNPADAFHDITSFLAFIKRAEYSYGETYEVSLDSREDFHGDQSFVQLALPKAYPIRLQSNVVHFSKFGVIVFFLDFCVMVAKKDFYWGEGPGRVPSTILKDPTILLSHSIDLRIWCDAAEGSRPCCSWQTEECEELPGSVCSFI